VAERELLPGLTLVTSAHNEEEVLAGCLESVQGVADEIVVVNSGSDDGTRAIAERFTDKVLDEPNRLMLNVNKNVAIDAATREWVLLLDPDERMTPELAEEVRRVVASSNGRYAGYWIPRRNYELGTWIRTMGKYPDPQLRLFRNGSARFPCNHIHEMVEVDGDVGDLPADMLHYTKQSLFEYVHKRNLYSEHRAEHLAETGARFSLRDMLVQPLKAFVKDYFVRRGYRQGVPGLIIAVSAGYGVFLQHAKLWQKTQGPKLPEGRG
jgi:glycosyltransferase involved in cell wall biosynthesis